LILVCNAEAVGSNEDTADFVETTATLGARRKGALDTAFIEAESNEAHVSTIWEASDDRFCIGHLGDEAGVDETRHFNPPGPHENGALNQLQLLGS
jgi:hypothetical protein